jgi:exopolysaccharide biosynthesis polyprenyl glycosylphosphotransferase
LLQRPRKKPPQSVRPLATEFVTKMLTTSGAVAKQTGLAFLLPKPLQKRGAMRWIRSVAADSALVGLNWLLLGALLVPLRMVFPRVLLFEFDVGAPAKLLGIGLLHAVLITLIAHAEGLYAVGKDLRWQARILCQSILLATAALGVSYSLQGAAWSTSVLFCCASVLHFGTLWTRRWHSVKHLQRSDHIGNVRNVLIVGAGETGRRVAAFLEAYPQNVRTVYGFLDNERPMGDGVIGRVQDLARLARKGFIDEIILAGARDRELTLQVLREARRLRLDVEIVPELYGCPLEKHAIDWIGDLPAIGLHAERLPFAELGLKRLVDVVGAGVALIFVSPLLVLIAIGIRLDSRGPIFYRAQRAGLKGRLFRCYKFRTMVDDADALKDRLRSNNERSGPFFKITNDPRITRLGRFLRRYSLDELPQLWNVLKGEMSLVGPRPHPADDYAAYEIEHLARLDVRPGITGLWQVTARRDPSFERGMQLDREYIRTWSLGSDLRILARTVSAVLHGSGQ